MKGKIIIGFLLMMVMITSVLGANQDIPIQFQLRDSNGNNIVTTTSVEFNFYNVSTGGTSLHNETYNVSFNQGVGNVILPDVTLNYFQDYWIGINPNSSGELSPRVNYSSYSLDTSNFYLDSVNDRVGIGTNSPISLTELSGDNGDARLTITGTGTSPSRDSSILFRIATSNVWNIGVDDSDSDKLKIATGSSVGSGEVITLDSSGNVGIGTTSPTAILDISSTVNDVPSLILNSANDVSSGLYLRCNNNAQKQFIQYTSAGLIFRDASKNVEMVIDSNANLGIGTSSPTQKLDVNGAINITGVTDGSITCLLYNGANCVLGTNGTSNFLYSPNGGSVLEVQDP